MPNNCKSPEMCMLSETCVPCAICPNAKEKADDRLARTACSPSSRRYKCDECHDTGYFGDMGPGRAGNNEYVPCDCRRDKRTDDEKWRDHFVLPIATEMKRRGIGEMRIKLTEKGTAVFELLPENAEVEGPADNATPQPTKSI